MNHPTLDTYLNLCTQVYDLSKPNPPKDAYALYREYAQNCKGLILEPMCGTGRFLLPFLEEGFDIQGFDASPHMLEALRAKAKVKNLEPNVWHGFLADLESITKYALIFIPSGSFGLITDLGEARLCLKKIYDQLENEGTFVFEAETLDAAPNQFNIWRGSAWNREDGKCIITNFVDLPPVNCVFSTLFKYELIDGHSLVKTEIEKLKIRLYEPYYLIDMLKEAGFKQIVLRKAFDRTQSPKPDDGVVICECRK
jgi:SAM-dependent methyltransferase